MPPPMPPRGRGLKASDGGIVQNLPKPSATQRPTRVRRLHAARRRAHSLCACKRAHRRTGDGSAPATFGDALLGPGPCIASGRRNCLTPSLPSELCDAVARLPA